MHPIGDALVVITSDNDDNIKGGIWQEVIAAHEKAQAEGRPFPGQGHPRWQVARRPEQPDARCLRPQAV